MKTLKIADCTVRFHDEGRGPPLVFLHNGGTSRAIWDAQLQALCAQYRVVALDFPGFGDSDKPRIAYDLPLLCSVLSELIRQEDLQRPILVGNCMGSAAALAYALNRPDSVSGLFLCNVLTERTIAAGALGILVRLSRHVPGLRRLLAAQPALGGLPAPLRRWVAKLQLGPSQRLPPVLAERLDELYRSSAQLRVLGSMTAHLDSFGCLDRLPRPQTFPPLWMLWGERNRVLPLQAGRRFAEQFGVDRWETLAGTGHLPMAEAPAPFTALLCEFCRSHFVDSPKLPTQGTSAPHDPIEAGRYFAQRTPDKPAVIQAASATRPERRVSFGDLWHMTNRAAWQLAERGVGSGDRVLMLVPPGPEFLALFHALHMLGATAIFIDGGMPLRQMSACIAQCRPNAMIGNARAHGLRLLAPRALRSVRRYFSVGTPPPLPSTNLLRNVPVRMGPPFPSRSPDSEALAAILFTSGSTGAPKGVELSVRNQRALGELLARLLEASRSGDVAIVLYPLFLQIFAQLGRTSVLPDIDFSRPAQADPAHVVQCMQTYEVTTGFGSPAIWVRVAELCRAQDIVLDKVRMLLAAGAPVAPRQVIAPLSAVIPNGRILTPYGATEALPVAAIDSAEINAETARLAAEGAGTCVGRPLPGVSVRVVPICDEAIADIGRAPALSTGEIGEICVAGDNVTQRYFSRPDQTREAKIRDASAPGGLWHRMGDLGYLDAQGRLWFCGRKRHRVTCPEATYFAQQPEGIADAIPGVFRSALVGMAVAGRVHPVLVVEPERGGVLRWDRLAVEIARRLRERGFPIEAAHVLLHEKSFPVDPRHNAKINREALAVWATATLGASAPVKPRTGWIARRRNRAAHGWG